MNTLFLKILALGRALGPYVALALLPGGSLIAVLLWVYRQNAEA